MFVVPGVGRPDVGLGVCVEGAGTGGTLVRVWDGGLARWTTARWTRWFFFFAEQNDERKKLRQEQLFGEKRRDGKKLRRGEKKKIDGDDGPLEATEERSLPLAMEAFQMFLFG